MESRVWVFNIIHGSYSDEDTDQGARQFVRTSWLSIIKITFEVLHYFNSINQCLVIKIFVHIVSSETV